MGIREDLLNVMHLQHDYSSKDTDAMRLRGEIIRNRIPTLVRSEREALSANVGIDLPDFLVEGGDGIGRKARVPWIRFSSRSRSPGASIGWYVVWLFKEDGTGVYLALSHASTENIEGALIDRSPEETQRLMNWAREILRDKITGDSHLSSKMTLGSGRLAKAYERTTVTSYFYPQNDFPTATQLHADMQSMAKMLGQLYSGEPAQRRTKETSLDVIAALITIEEATSGRSFTGQGFGLTQAQRRVVELRAMAIATDHFTNLGFTVEDTSANRPYDLKVTKGADTLYIEVKGTTGALGDIVLTKNEVDHHRRHHPFNGLIVVHGIKLNKEDVEPKAKGGTPYIQVPWEIENYRLVPIVFRYSAG